MRIFAANLKLKFKSATMNSDKLINRTIASAMKRAVRYLPVVTLIGPRQSGKTTLCRQLFNALPYANFEDAATLSEARNDPKAFIGKYPQGVIIDEAQRFPEIFSYLQVAVDEDRLKGGSVRQFVVTGSSNFALLQEVTQSMAGRTAILTLLPLSVQELSEHGIAATTSQLILRGGYPSVWTADDDGRQIILSNYYSTYVERDLRQLVNIRDLQAFQTFIRLCAGRIGTEFNASSLSVEVGVSVPTIKSWLSVLEASYIVFMLHPYYSSMGKRLVKTPKLYFYDTGLASWLMGINTVTQLDVHPLRGALFENLVVSEMMKHSFNTDRQPRLFFYRDRRQHEVDLLEEQADGTLHAYEIKSGTTYRQDFFSQLVYLRTVMGEKITSSLVLYDGDAENPKEVDGILNFRHIYDTK